MFSSLLLLALSAVDLKTVGAAPAYGQAYAYGDPCGSYAHPWIPPQVRQEDPCHYVWPPPWRPEPPVPWPACCVYQCSIECPPYDDPQPPEPDPSDGDCPWRVPGWAVLAGRHIYLGEIATDISWFEADAKAKEQSAHLAEIRSQEETEIFQQVKNCYPAGTRLWIGGNDLAITDAWVWSRGQRITGYYNWAMDFSRRGHCMELRFPEYGGLNEWHRADCFGRNVPHAFLAQRDSREDNDFTPATTTTTRTTTTTTITPSSRPTYNPEEKTTTAFGPPPTPARR